jgi:hypothetical protein
MHVYRIYNRKTIKKWRPKMVTYPCISLATNPTNLGILLQLSPSHITNRLSIDLHLVFSRLPHTHLSNSCQFISSNFCRCLYHVEPHRPSNFTLPSRLTSILDLFSIYLDFDLLSINLDFNLLPIQLNFDHQSIHLD